MVGQMFEATITFSFYEDENYFYEDENYGTRMKMSNLIKVNFELC